MLQKTLLLVTNCILPEIEFGDLHFLLSHIWMHLLPRIVNVLARKSIVEYIYQNCPVSCFIFFYCVRFIEGERILIRSYASDAIRFQAWFGPTSASTSCYCWWHGNQPMFSGKQIACSDLFGINFSRIFLAVSPWEANFCCYLK